MMYFDDNGNEQTTTIDLTKINELEIDYSKFIEGTNNFDFELPFSKKQIRPRKFINPKTKKISYLGETSTVHFKPSKALIKK